MAQGEIPALLVRTHQMTGSQRSRRQVALAWPVMALQEKNQQRITLVIHDDGVGFDVPAHIAFD